MGKKKKSKRRSMRKGMKKERRMELAKAWIGEYDNKKVVKVYRKKYCVDWACAFRELRLLGVAICDEHEKQVMRSVESVLEARRLRKAEKEAEDFSGGLFGQDDHLYFIAGYTSNGVPYGLTWEEMAGELDGSDYDF